MIKKTKISELPLTDTLVGLTTIGVDANNNSVKVELEFLSQSADNATVAAAAANMAADKANGAAEFANAGALAANSATQQAVDAADNATAATASAVAATEDAIAATTAATEATALTESATEAAVTATTAANTAAQSANEAKEAATAAAASANTAATLAAENAELAGTNATLADQSATRATDAAVGVEEAIANTEAATVAAITATATIDSKIAAKADLIYVDQQLATKAAAMDYSSLIELIVPGEFSINRNMDRSQVYVRTFIGTTSNNWTHLITLPDTGCVINGWGSVLRSSSIMPNQPIGLAAIVRGSSSENALGFLHSPVNFDPGTATNTIPPGATYFVTLKYVK